MKKSIPLLLLLTATAFSGEFWVMRHGQTTDNRDKVVTGSRDPELTEKGLAQAEEMAKTLQDICFSHLCSSTKKRAVKTLHIVKGEGSADERLCEIDFGTLNGQPYATTGIPKLPYLEFRDYVTNRFHAEPAENTFDRLSSFLKENGDAERMLVVAHGGIQRALLHMAGELQPNNLPNCGIYKFHYDPKTETLSLIP